MILNNKTFLGFILILFLSFGEGNAKSNREIKKELKALVAGKTIRLSQRENSYFYFAPGGVVYYVRGGKVKRSHWGIKYFSGELQICVNFSHRFTTSAGCGSKKFFLKRIVGDGDIYRLATSRTFKS